ncbi:four helix bundle protein [Mucilaginibacter pineti]|uniref:Four helix bundle protein n=1 Tax=Mucilaginibacter pineti TaxID=1391627 RepID=A0A1G6TVX1_9SPHI|nr:four helix bundle protein [Mucilaginibacter pineti]SDD33054.1 four helix bundle protein [Mucilaginibacter pineti]
MRDYKKLDIWKKSHLLTKQVYAEVLPIMPVEERFALTNQLRTYSIPLNIVEGCGKNTDKDFVHYLDNALGSAHEVEYTCYLIYDLGLIPKEIYNKIHTIINEVKAMLIGFIKFLRGETFNLSPLTFYPK